MSFEAPSESEERRRTANNEILRIKFHAEISLGGQIDGPGQPFHRRVGFCNNRLDRRISPGSGSFRTCALRRSKYFRDFSLSKRSREVIYLMTTAAVLLIGAMIVAIIFTGPTIWYDWKENRAKRLAKATVS